MVSILALHLAASWAFSNSLDLSDRSDEICEIYPGDPLDFCNIHCDDQGVNTNSLCHVCIVDGPATFYMNENCVYVDQHGQYLGNVIVTISCEYLEGHHIDMAKLFGNVSNTTSVVSVTLLIPKNNTYISTVDSTKTIILRFKPCINQVSFPTSLNGFCVDYFSRECYWNIANTPCNVGQYIYSYPSDNCGISSSLEPNPGYCFTPYPPDPTQLIIGQCPHTVSWFNQFLLYHNLTMNPVADIDYYCQTYNYNYTNRLCGSCSNGDGIPINSWTLECSCVPSNSLLSSVVMFILLELLPVTVMIAILIILGIDLTDGAITGYIFSSQMSSVPIPVIYETQAPLYIIYGYDYFYQWTYLIVSFFSIWNLDFITPLGYFLPICITNTALEAIAVWYIVAIYPLVLLLVLYVWIIMYEKGYRVVVCITRPFHRLLARFWQAFNIHPSLIHSIAGVYILTFTQFAATSLKLLHFTTWKSITNETIWGVAFYYDGSVDYFGWPHAVYGCLAIVMLVIFVIIPMLHLLLYPFKCYQILLGLCKVRKEFLVAISDALSGTYKNGTDNSYDYRYFAGLYLLLRIIIIYLFYIPFMYGQTIGFVCIGIFSLFGAAIAIFRPHKRNIHNFSSIFVLLCYTVFCILQFYPPQNFTFNINYILCLFVAGYCMYKIIKKTIMSSLFPQKSAH